jgi:HD-GYP domain-containing protein (c-di-GMP phosphodiesterase class II)
MLMSPLFVSSPDARRLTGQFIQGLLHMLDTWDHSAIEHSTRVTHFAVQLAKLRAWHEPQLTELQWGAMLHDIGKVCIPAPLLVQEGPLSDEDWAVVKHHPIFGYDLLRPVETLALTANIVLCHHENWDGSGYPRCLKGEEIPPGARIVAVAEVWDALTSHPEDRANWPKERVFAYIRDHSGKKFDPEVVKTFFELVNQG